MTTTYNNFKVGDLIAFKTVAKLKEGVPPLENMPHHHQAGFVLTSEEDQVVIAPDLTCLDDSAGIQVMIVKNKEDIERTVKVTVLCENYLEKNFSTAEIDGIYKAVEENLKQLKLIGLLNKMSEEIAQ